MGLSPLAEMRPETRDKVAAQIILAEPEHETRIRASLADAINSDRQHGFAATFGTWFSYINAVGVAFRPSDGSPLVAITCGEIVDIIPQDACMSRIGPDLVRVTAHLRARLNGQPELTAAQQLPSSLVAGSTAMATAPW